MRSLLTSRGITFLVLGLVTVTVGMLMGYPDVTRIGVLLIVLVLACVLWAWRRPPRLTLARAALPSRLTPEERGRVIVDFRNDARRSTPLYLAEEKVDLALGEPPRFLLPRLDHREVRRLEYRIRGRERGVYHLGPVHLRQRDPFGLTLVTHAIGSSQELLVLPRVERLGAGADQGTGAGEAGEQTHLIALRGEDDVSIREYRDGDEMRRVHWPATAHRGELMVRQDDRPIHRRAVVILDSRAAAHGVAHPGGTSPSYEWAVSAAASLVVHLRRAGFLVHLLTEQSVLDGEASEDVGEDVALGLLARIQPDPDADLGSLARAAQMLLSGGALVVAVVAGDGHEEEIRQVASVRDPQSPCYALVLTPSSGTDPTAHAAVFRRTGWRTQVVEPGTSVAQAWGEIAGDRVPTGGPS